MRDGPGHVKWRGRRVAGIALLLVVGFSAITLLALEGGEVVQLRTVGPDGAVRSTRTWIADADGAMWIESATPDRPFLLDIARQPEVDLVRGVVLPVRAVPEPGEAGHRKIRDLLRARYGWADVWIGLLADTSHSVAVRLVPRTPDPAGR